MHTLDVERGRAWVLQSCWSISWAVSKSLRGVEWRECSSRAEWVSGTPWVSEGLSWFGQSASSWGAPCRFPSPSSGHCKSYQKPLESVRTTHQRTVSGELHCSLQRPFHCSLLRAFSKSCCWSRSGYGARGTCSSSLPRRYALPTSDGRWVSGHEELWSSAFPSATARVECSACRAQSCSFSYRVSYWQFCPTTVPLEWPRVGFWQCSRQAAPFLLGLLHCQTLPH